ncbi:MAG: hypothetical protein AB8B72_11805 [Crocinitomicaceae bacterium]
MNNKNYQLTPNKFIKYLTVIHFALIFGLVLLSVVFYFTAENWYLDSFETGNIFFYIVPIIAISAIFIGDFIYKMLVKNLKTKTSLKDKLMGFQAATIIKLATIEGPAMFALIAGLISSNFFFFIIAFLLILYMYSLKPTKLKVEEILDLSSDHKVQFNNGDEVIN